MEKFNQPQSRKRFISLGVIAAATLTAFRFLIPQKSEKKVDTQRVKMLTQDGKLVEIDTSLIASGKKEKITKEQLKDWVSKK